MIVYKLHSILTTARASLHSVDAENRKFARGAEYREPRIPNTHASVNHRPAHPWYERSNELSRRSERANVVVDIAMVTTNLCLGGRNNGR